LFQLLEAFQLLTQAWMTFITSILICWSGSGVKVFRCFPNGFRQWPGISVGLLVWRFSTNNKIWTGSEIMAWIFVWIFVTLPWGMLSINSMRLLLLRNFEIISDTCIWLMP